MSRRRVLLLVVVVVASLPVPASARSYYHRSSRGRGYGGGGGGGGGTVYSSYANGLGSLIRSQGAYNQMTAQAMIAVEQARTLALDNKLKTAQTYYQLRRINENEQAIQERKRLAMYAHVDPPKIPRPRASQLDRVTGTIVWPAVLADARFAEARKPVETLFGLRALDASQVTDTQIEHATNSLRDKLDATIDAWSTNDFFASRHFLESLAAEGRYTGLEAHPAVADSK